LELYRAEKFHFQITPLPQCDLSRTGHWLQIRPRSVNSLMVAGVDPPADRHLRRLRPFKSMRQGVGFRIAMPRQVRNERAAERHVHQLNSPANPEHRHS
jgi:hypothetical protein